MSVCLIVNRHHTQLSGDLVETKSALQTTYEYDCFINFSMSHCTTAFDPPFRHVLCLGMYDVCM